MSTGTVDYDRIAPHYDERYRVNRLAGVEAHLKKLAIRSRAQRALEVGCGTGYWLASIQPRVPQVFGLDLSQGMLRKAASLRPGGWLVCGQAGQLPYSSKKLDLVFCVNAFHHFLVPSLFIQEAYRLLQPGGALAIIGMDPHRGRDRWYLYEFFPGTLETDLRRFPSAGAILDQMAAAGFQEVEWSIAEHIFHLLTGREVLGDPFLQKNGTSQLALLDEQNYAEGISRIHATLQREKERVFPVDIELTAITGWKGE